MSLLLVILMIQYHAVAKSLNIEQAFEAAQKTSEILKSKNQAQLQAEEQSVQARGAIFPKISAIGTYNKQDTSKLTSSQKSTILEDSTGARLNATHTLFKGTQEYATLRLTSRNYEAAEFEVEHSRRVLLGQVARDFFELLSAKRDLENLQTMVDLTQKRVDELQRRARVGRARRGELLQSQAQYSLAQAQMLDAANKLSRARTALFGLTGITDADPQDDLLLEKLGPFEAYFEKIEKRADIRSLQKRSEAANEGVAMARGAHLPSIELSGNYHLKRDGSLEKVNWDVGLVLTLPIFEGGVTQSRVREASAVHRQRELELSLARRTAEKEIRDLHNAVESGMKMLEMLKESARLSEQNYKEQLKDNRFGLVTSLEVIQALNSFVESRRSLDRVSSEIKTAYLQLKAIVGEIK